MQNHKNYSADNGYVNPLFSTYGTPLAKQLTDWLYCDQTSNPLWNQPSQWAKVGRVAFLDRTVTFESVAPGDTSTQSVNLGGGKNILLFSRQASLRDTATAGVLPASTPNTRVLPNELGSYCVLKIERQSGFIDTETAPVNNNFGFGFQPYIRPVPEFWLGNEIRTFTFTNSSDVTVRADFTFCIALLDTGR